MFARDLLRHTLVLLLAGLLGALLDATLPALLAGGLLLLVWQQANLTRLLRWLQHPKSHAAPELPGVFEELCVEVDKLRERHKKRKKKLGRYLNQFQQATRALPDATIVMDRHGAVQWANKAASHSLGVNWPADAGRRLTNLVRSPELRAYLERQLPDSTLDFVSPVAPDLYLSLRLVPFAKDDWLLVARDVTELQRANKIRTDFVANVSHELRTPITVFRGYLEAIGMREAEFPADVRPAFAHLRDHAARMQSIIEELLLLSRLEQQDRVANPQPVPVPELLAEVQQQARALSGAQAHIFSFAVDPEVLLLGDARELFSAFSNLVFNAVQYTPPRGVIELRWYRDDAGAHFAVRDNGIGIAPHDIPRLTERFYRVDEGRARSSGGTGLGLAIVKHVLQRHQGSLHIESEPGKGSLFRCDFPPAVVLTPEHAAPADQARGADR